MMVKKYFFLFLLSIPYVVSSQNLFQTVYGRITDAESGIPLFGASIIVLDSDPIVGAVSDFDGFYKLENVPVGRHDLVVKYLGYHSQTIPQILVSSGKALNIDIPLTESIQSVSEVEITATKEGRSTSEVSNEMATVSARTFDLEQSSRFAGSLTDPSRLVLSFPGVRNQGDIQNGISVRGNTPSGLLWAVDGYEVPNPNHYARDNSQGAVNMISSNFLQRADFYTGAFPAQYGNAGSGVFDLYLRKGNSEKVEVSLAAGMIGMEASIEGPLSKSKKASFLVSGRYSTLSLFNAIGYSVSGNDQPTFHDVNYKFHFPTKKAGTFQVFGFYGNSKISPNEVIELDYLDGYRLSVSGLKHNIRLTDKSFLKSAVIYSDINSIYEEYSTKERYKDNGDYRGYSLRSLELPITERRVQFDTKVNTKYSARLSQIAGVNVQYAKYSLGQYYSDDFYRYRPKGGTHELRSESADTVAANVNATKVQAFLQQKFKVTEGFSFTYGVHLQAMDYNKSFSAEPRLGAQLNYGNQHQMTFGFGMHSRLESLGYYGSTRTYYLAPNFQPEKLTLNKELKPTKSIHFVWGNKFRIVDKLFFEIEGYYQHIYNVPVDTFTNSVHASINYEYSYYSAFNSNQGLARNMGIDMTLEKAFHKNYYFLINASIYDSKYRAYDGVWRNTRYNGNFLLSTTFGKDFVIGKENNNRLSLNAKSMWAGNNRDENYIHPETMEWLPFEVRFANYFRLDTRIAYTRNKLKYSWTLSLDIQNTTNRLNEAANERVNSQGLIPFVIYKVDL